MGKLKSKLQDGTINIPGLILKLFLIWFIFIHRNIKEYKNINKLELNKNKLETFRTSLLELKAVKAYQTEMF